MAKISPNYEKSLYFRLKTWIEGNNVPFDTLVPHCPPPNAKQHEETSGIIKNEMSSENITPDTVTHTPEYRIFGRIYHLLSVIVGVALITVLMITISYLPRFGDPSNPYNTEVSERYIEKGLEETGAVNIVSGMILDYRAFDTFGESCVLFSAVTCVFILLRTSKDKKEILDADANDRKYEPKNDPILQKIAAIIVPTMLLFGIYIVLNGHLSAGGGFSGGAVIGSGLILNLLAFGFDKAGRVFSEKTFKICTTSALSFYCLSKCYSFFTGANGLESHIPLGKAGAILSSGLILPLNICVGLVVACTMYAFYVMFRKGQF